jgi:hypothetical protein
MGSTGYVGMENPITSPAVPVPKHRGIDIAEEENGDAKHRHPASHVLVTTNSLHLSCKDRQKRQNYPVSALLAVFFGFSLEKC